MKYQRNKKDLTGPAHRGIIILVSKMSEGRAEFRLDRFNNEVYPQDVERPGCVPLFLSPGRGKRHGCTLKIE